MKGTVMGNDIRAVTRAGVWRTLQAMGKSLAFILHESELLERVKQKRNI